MMKNDAPFKKSFRAILLRADEDEPELVRMKYLVHYAAAGDFMEFVTSPHAQPPYHFSDVKIETERHIKRYTVIRSSSPANNGKKLNQALKQRNTKSKIRGDILIVLHKYDNNKIFETIRAADVDDIVFDMSHLLC